MIAFSFARGREWFTLAIETAPHTYQAMSSDQVAV
jgi:hypothetical protein